MGGVHSYFLIDASQAAAAVQAKQATDDSSKPSSKKAAKKQLAKTLLEIKGITQNVQLQIMGPTTLRSLTHADDINALVSSARRCPCTAVLPCSHLQEQSMQAR